MIRKATFEDIPNIFPLIDVIWQDMDFPFRRLVPFDVFQTEMLAIMALPEHKFSITHYWVYEIDGHIAGILSGYKGLYENQYDENLLAIIDARFPDIHIRHYTPEKETTDDEWYLDSIVVHPDYRGQGIGKLFFNALPDLLPDESVIGLNCDEQNSRAEKLYHAIGFTYSNTITFYGHTYHHLQKSLR